MEEKAAKIIGRKDLKIEDGKYTPEILWALGRVEGYGVSSDGKKIAYEVTYFDLDENKGHTVLRVVDADGKNDILLTTTAASESSPHWIKGDSKIAFLSDEGGSSQLWEMNPDGSERKKLSDIKQGIDDYIFAPDQKHILFIAQVAYTYRPEEYFKGLDKTTGLMADDLMYKFWDHWKDTVPHPFYAPFDGEKLGEATDILAGTRFESPMDPGDPITQLTWSTDSKKIAYTCEKKFGRDFAFSSDSDIYVYDIETKEEVNICKLPGDPDQNVGTDTNPAYSPSGKYIAWISMRRDGYQCDKARICVMELATGKKFYITENLDNDVDEFIWNADSDDIYFAAIWHGTTMVYHIDLNGNYTQVTEGDYDYYNIGLCGKQIIALRHSLLESDDIYLIDPQNDNGITRITCENDHIMNQLKLGTFKARWTPTVDGKELHSWVMYPPEFDPSKKYPAWLLCMGGPQEAVSQFWSYRWNMLLLAAQGYVITMPNRRGVPGFGRKWLEEVSNDYSGLCMQDYFAAIDDLVTEPYIDKDKVGCVGASFGGYSVYYLAGNHEKRFKVFLSHDGMFNLEEFFLGTDWYMVWESGGNYWDKNNPVAQKFFADSPHNYVEKWDTPILCIHSNMDYRIPVAEGQAAFAAARLRGIDAQYLYYPDECHWVLKPQNSVLWYRIFINWMDKYLK